MCIRDSHRTNTTNSWSFNETGSCFRCRCGDKDLSMTEIVLIGRKLGMTREFYKSGHSVPVTVIKLNKGRVIQVIDKEKRGYDAVQLGFGKVKSSKLTKSMKGFFAKKNTEAKRKLKELLWF